MASAHDGEDPLSVERAISILQQAVQSGELNALRQAYDPDVHGQTLEDITDKWSTEPKKDTLAIAADSPTPEFVQCDVSFPSKPVAGWVFVWSNTGRNRECKNDDEGGWQRRGFERLRLGLKVVFGMNLEDTEPFVAELDGCGGNDYQPMWRNTASVPASNGPVAFLQKLPEFDILFMAGIRAMGTNLSGLQILLARMKADCRIIILNADRTLYGGHFSRSMTAGQLLEACRDFASPISAAARTIREILQLSRARALRGAAHVHSRSSLGIKTARNHLGKFYFDRDVIM